LFWISVYEGISGIVFNGPDTLPLTQPTVSYYRKLKAQTPNPWPGLSTAGFLRELEERRYFLYAGSPMSVTGNMTDKKQLMNKKFSPVPD